MVENETTTEPAVSDRRQVSEEVCVTNESKVKNRRTTGSEVYVYIYIYIYYIYMCIYINHTNCAGKVSLNFPSSMKLSEGLLACMRRTASQRQCGARQRTASLTDRGERGRGRKRDRPL